MRDDYLNYTGKAEVEFNFWASAVFSHVHVSNMLRRPAFFFTLWWNTVTIQTIRVISEMFVAVSCNFKGCSSELQHWRNGRSCQRHTMLQWHNYSDSHEMWAVDGKSDLSCLRAVTQTCRLSKNSSVGNMCWAIVTIFRALLHLHHHMRVSSCHPGSIQNDSRLQDEIFDDDSGLSFSPLTSHNVHVYFCCNLPPSSEYISILHITQLRNHLC